MSLTFLEERLAILTRTPAVLDAQLRDLPAVWTAATEGEGTWMTRLKIILDHGPSRPFDSFDREAQFRESAGAPLNALLDQFRELREANLRQLIALDVQPDQLDLMGTHPALGAVTLRQLLSTWTAHDLAHLLQINRVMARRYRDDVGPWARFLSVMQ